MMYQKPEICWSFMDYFSREGAMNLKLLFVDVETTGTDPAKHGIIQLSGAIQMRDEATDSIVPTGNRDNRFNFRIKPSIGDVIEDSALVINGITREDLQSNDRMDAQEARRQFVSLLCQYVDKYKKYDKFFFVGFSATFDDNFCRALFNKCGDKYYGSLICWPPIDVAAMAALKLGTKRLLLPNFKLATVAAAAGIPVDPQRTHDAMYDIDLTIKIFDWCQRKGSDASIDQQSVAT
jgi:DNA polymerase-3 subunit epsilon